MAEDSYPWGGTTTGDAGAYTHDEWTKMYRKMFLGRGENGSCILPLDNMFIVSNSGTSIYVASGVANIHGTYYQNTAQVTLAASVPGAGTYYYSVFLRKDWTAQTVRAVLSSPSAVSYPTATQTDGATWEEIIAYVSVTSGSVVTITDNRHTLIKLKPLLLTVQGAKPRQTSGCQGLSWTELTTYYQMVGVMNFDGGSTDEFCQWAGVRMPPDYTGGAMYAQFLWTQASASAGDVKWGIQAVAVADGGLINNADFGTAVTVVDSGGSANYLYMSAVTAAMTPGGTPTNSKVLWIQAYRDASDTSNDTLSIDAGLIGVMLWYPVY